ncbi:MAG TPA: glycine--tRNA ligase subunit beta [Stellaceae bacterium]|nr:glycine--tRNA ligase subunit beta [Stellaceae bacterium]
MRTRVIRGLTKRRADGELLLELLTEEIPARMQRRAIDDLVGLIRDRLKAAGIPAASIEGQVTPRRLVVIADGIPARQPDRQEERRGPRVGSPEAAIGGFLRAAGLTSLDQCEVRGSDRGEFYFAVVKQPGRATAEVLPDLVVAAMGALPWPKSMRYPASEMRWVRPLNSVVCLFDGEVVALPLGAVPVGRVTRGHRFLAPAEITVANAADYRAKLKAAYVVLDRKERRATIDEELTALARAAGLTVKPDETLLDEVTGLVEYPVVLMGSIDADFVRPLPDGLPPEVLATAMRTHQKYFTCLNPDGSPAPRFLFVANNVTPDGGKTIAAGNERVLRARLSDARFFWDQDRKVRLADRVEALKQRVYHEKLGSVYDKVERMEKLADYLAPFVGADPAHARRAARLAKADLSTGMVGEFPELQGIMGRYYALKDGEDPRVGNAIADHYRPLGPSDPCSTGRESIVIALADKIDALTAFFSADERPTGSGDPFALRRAALGIIRVILENRPIPLRLPMTRVFRAAAGVGHFIDLSAELLQFIVERLKVHLRDRGFKHDMIAACFMPGGKTDDDLARIVARVEALKTFLDADYGANLLIAYRRASNIVAIEEKKDHREYDGPVDTARLKMVEESVLLEKLDEVTSYVTTVTPDVFEPIFSALTQLRRPVDDFFEKVTVNAPDPELRVNRLRLLARIRSTMNQVADFSQIEG